MSYFSNDINRTLFPPPGNGPYFIDLDWCMGDSLNYINKNNEIFAYRTVELSTLFLLISSFSVNLSGKDTATIDIGYNSRSNFISAEVIDQSLRTIKLGGDVTHSGRALLTAAGLSGLKDVSFSNEFFNGDALVYSTDNNKWTNVSVASIALDTLVGNRGDIKITNEFGEGLLFTIQGGSNDTLDDERRAVTTDKIKNEAVTYKKLFGNTSSTAPALFWTTSNVGIGTTTNLQRLTVARAFTWPFSTTIDDNIMVSLRNPSYGTGEQRVLDMGVIRGGSAYIRAVGGTAPSPVGTKSGHLILQPGSGNVGVGTTNPASLFQVNGTLHATTLSGELIRTLTPGTYIVGDAFNNRLDRTWNIDATEANTASKIVVRDSSSNINVNTINTSEADTTTVSGAIAYRINGSTDSRLRFCSNATSLRDYLDVPSKGGSGANGRWDIDISGKADTAGNADTVTNGVTTSRNIATIGGLTGGGSLANDLSLSLTGQASRFHSLNSAGIVVRTSTEVLARSIAAGTGISVENGDGTEGNPTISIPQSIGTGDAVQFGSLGVGTAPPASNTGEIRTNGDITAFYSASDIRLKENIETITNPLQKVESLRGVNFTYKSDGRKSTGLIAQDLEKVLPEAVYENEEGMMNVRYQITIGLLVEAIKELSQEVKELKSKIKE